LAIPALLALAAWQITPRLNWARYRQGIAAIAATQLGRDVTIDGPIHLALFPRPELTAQGVTIADRGDGISARVGALRATVAIGPLLRGRLVALSLRLDDPVVTVPWPLPATKGNVPAIARGFSAQMEGGTLRLGGLELHAIDADVHTDPDTGALSAQGDTNFGSDASVHFVAIVGAPGNDGVSTLSLTLTGSQRFAGAVAAFHGRRRADGAIEGTIRADGPDAARLLPAPAQRWQLEGPVAFTFANDIIRAPTLSFLLGQSPGQASAAWHVSTQPRLDVTAKLGQIQLGPWVEKAASTPAPLDTHFDLTAAAATLAGGTLRDVHLAMMLTPTRTSVENAQATLPGGAPANFIGTVQNNSLAGTLRVHLPNLRATLAWLQASLPALEFVPSSLQSGDFSTNIALTQHTAIFTKIDTRLNSTSLHADARWDNIARPKLTATISANNIDATGFPFALAVPTDLATNFAQADADITLNAAHLRLPGVALTALQLHATGDESGLAIPHLAADLPGAHLDAAGTLKSDGTIADTHLNLDADDAAELPAAWRPLPGLAHGPLHLALNAAGPPHAIAMQARCDLGDARAELDSTFDPTARTLAGTATLRHPGAPRLLHDAGIDDAARWLGQGSVAIVVHFAARPGSVSATDITIAAASLRLNAKGSIDFSGPIPNVEATINAPSLVLPALDASRQAPLPLPELAAWQGHIHFAADEILNDQWPVATNANAELAASGGVLAANDISAHIAGGTLSGAAALDTAAATLAAQGEMVGIALTSVAGPPWVWSGGATDFSFGLIATGHSPAALLASAGGDAQGTMHEGVLTSLNLPAITRLLSARAPKLRAALNLAMTTGQSGPLSGDITAKMDDGAVSVTATNLTNQAGTIDYTSTIDLPAHTEDTMIRLRPAVPAPPTLDARIVGPWQQPKRTVNVRDAISWAGKGSK
jgi:uncharacterized protein involved in outer membrane biogenesis